MLKNLIYTEDVCGVLGRACSASYATVPPFGVDDILGVSLITPMQMKIDNDNRPTPIVLPPIAIRGDEKSFGWLKMARGLDG